MQEIGEDSALSPCFAPDCGTNLSHRTARRTVPLMYSCCRPKLELAVSEARTALSRLLRSQGASDQDAATATAAGELYPCSLPVPRLCCTSLWLAPQQPFPFSYTYTGVLPLNTQPQRLR